MKPAAILLNLTIFSLTAAEPTQHICDFGEIAVSHGYIQSDPNKHLCTYLTITSHSKHPYLETDLNLSYPQLNHSANICETIFMIIIAPEWTSLLLPAILALLACLAAIT
jgi:hypothetical protein